jgi:DNA repair protein RadC
MSIKDWPEGTQPREKLLANGSRSLADDELLAIFLRVGVKGKSAVELARDLIDHFGNLREILHADMDSFCEAKGLGPATYVQLQAVLEMSRRHLKQSLDRDVLLTSAQQTRDYLSLQLAEYHSEVFACLFLDNQHRVIKFEVLFYGTINHANVHPREVIKRALHHNAAAIILAHNHPSGQVKPSKADEELTADLKTALALIDVRVLDHFIVAQNQCVSMAELGLV